MTDNFDKSRPARTAPRNATNDYATPNIHAVAASLGLRSNGKSIYGCPACGAARRHTKRNDSRGAIGIRDNRWHCFQCEVGGSALDLAALKLFGKKMRDLGREQRDQVHAALGTAATASAAPLPEVPVYPPQPEVAEIWANAQRVDRDLEAAEWLAKERGLSPEAIAQLDVARVLPSAIAGLPEWAGYYKGAAWRSWPSCGLRLVVPLFDAAGELRSVLFRRTLETAANWPPKSVGARGFARQGLVMACPRARAILNGSSDHAADIAELVIAEGEMDFLTWAALATDARATLGIVAGSWTAEIAKRVPVGAHVVIATHPDAAGDRYADIIRGTL